MSLLIAGVVAYDKLQTPFGKKDRILGGSATHAAFSAALTEPDTRLLSVVGDDFEQQYIDLFRRHLIDTEGLSVIPGEKTFFWSGFYHEDMNTRETLETQTNVITDHTPQMPESYRRADYLLLANDHPATQARMISSLEKRPEAIIMDTMNLWINIALEDLKKVIPMTDLLLVNDEEARMLSGEKSLIKAARKIQDLGTKALIIKKGEHGAMLFQDRQMFFLPAYPLEDVFDPTGAGDAFAGAIAAYLSATRQKADFRALKTSMIYATVAASFCVEKFGSERLCEVVEEEFTRRVEKFRQMISF